MYTKEKKITIKTLLLSIAFVLIGIIGWEILLSFMNQTGFRIGQDSVLGNVLLELIFFSVPFFMIKRHLRSNTLSALGINFSIRHWMSKVGTGIVLGFIGIFLIYLILFATHIIRYTGFGFNSYRFITLSLYILGLFVRAFFAGVCEETFFRGLLQNYLGKIYHMPIALVASSILFSVFHCTRYENLYQLACVLLTGFAFGVLFLKTQSLFLNIGLHFATDFFINIPAPKGQLGLFIYSISPNYTEDSLMKVVFALLSVFYLTLLLSFTIFYKNREQPSS